MSRYGLFLALILAATAGLARQRETFGFDGKVSALFESGYLSSSGTLIDTRPSAEQQIDGTWHLADYGRLTAVGWIISALHGGRDADHRRAFYLSECTVGYGYDVTFSEDLDLVNEVGIVWDSPIGYKDYCWEEVGWWIRSSLENPVLVPYVEAIGLMTPDHWLRIAFGARHDFQLPFSLTLTPAVETVWGDNDRYYACYQTTPSQRFLGGAFMTLTPGFKLTWRLGESWAVWFRFREFIVVDPGARDYVRRQSVYYAKLDQPIFTLGASYSF